MVSMEMGIFMKILNFLKLEMFENFGNYDNYRKKI